MKRFWIGYATGTVALAAIDCAFDVFGHNLVGLAVAVAASLVVGLLGLLSGGWHRAT